MKAMIEDLGDVTIVSLIGYLDFESVEPFKKYCLGSLVQKRVIFNMKDLHFVGSSGITTFVDTMREYRALAPAQPRFAGVSSEFKRLFTVAHLAGLELFETPELAIYGTSAEIIPECAPQSEIVVDEDVAVDVLGEGIDIDTGLELPVLDDASVATEGESFDMGLGATVKVIEA